MEPRVNFQPGMFHLLDLHGERAMKQMLERAESYLVEFGGYPSTSINNVSGVLHSASERREDKEDAIDLFKQVLSDDAENINALENSRVVYIQLGLQEDAEECAKKLESLLGAENPKRDLALRKARCLAEQAFAITFDVAAYQNANDIGGEDLERNSEAANYFEEAFRMDDENFRVFKPEERLQWQFFLAQSYHHMYGHYIRMGSAPEEQVNTFDKAVHALIETARESSQTQYQAKAWGLLGTFFWKECGTKSARPQSVNDCDLLEEYRNPEICFRNAVDLSPKDSKILSRYSRFLMKKKRYSEAVDILDKSIRMDDSATNWFAISSRGQAYKLMYVQQQQEFKAACRARKRGNPPDKNLLEYAKEDYENAIEVHQSLQDRTRLGEIFNMLGQKDKALEQYQYVIDHLEGQKNPEVHKQMGFCLRSIPNSDPRRAIESFKRAVELERGDTSWLVSPLNALQLLITLYGDHPRCEYLLDELCYWLILVKEKYDHHSKLLQDLCRQFDWQMIRVCRRLVEQKKYSVASKCLSQLKGRNTAAERREIQELETEIRSVSGQMSALSLSEAEHGSESTNIRPALSKFRNQRKKPFDCLILHCKEKKDADWVYYSLLPRLEENHEYKCCVPARDMQSTDFDTCVGDADCVIVILTPSFCSDKDSMDQLVRLVGEGTSEVIPVVLEDCQLPEALNGTETIHYYNWERLLQGIERAPSQQ